MIIDSFITKEENKAVNLGKLTVFVGPNNCGKSQTLKDLYALMTSRNSLGKIIFKSLLLFISLNIVRAPLNCWM